MYKQRDTCVAVCMVPSPVAPSESGADGYEGRLLAYVLLVSRGRAGANGPGRGRKEGRKERVRKVREREGV